MRAHLALSQSTEKIQGNKCIARNTPKTETVRIAKITVVGIKSVVGWCCVQFKRALTALMSNGHAGGSLGNEKSLHWEEVEFIAQFSKSCTLSAF